MTFSRKFEFACGIITGALGFLPPFCKHGAHAFELFRLWPGLLLDAVLLFVLPGILVTVGSYFHAARNKTSGLVILFIGGIFLTLMGLIHFFGGVFYVFGLLGGTVVLLQSLMAIITMVSSFVVRSSSPATQRG